MNAKHPAHLFTTTLSSPLGEITVAANDHSLTGLWFIGQKYYPAAAPAWRQNPGHPVFAQVKAWLAAYFAEGNPRPALPSVPLDPQGTPFQQAVWKLLLGIPLGQTSTYGQLAARLGAQGATQSGTQLSTQPGRTGGRAKMSAQAVGGAVGHNPISLIIPCHRVLGSNGSLTGYAGGLDKKQALLRLEGALL